MTAEIVDPGEDGVPAVEELLDDHAARLACPHTVWSRHLLDGIRIWSGLCGGWRRKRKTLETRVLVDGVGQRE